MQFAATSLQDNRKLPTVVAVSSGKGGVGKTHIAANLAVALGTLGHRVMLFDADLGLANAGVILGVPVQLTIEDALARDGSLRAAVQPAPGGIGLISGGSGDTRMAALDEDGQSQLRAAFEIFRDEIDYLIIDTAAGIAPAVTGLVSTADLALAVLCDEPAAFIDAYGLLKALELQRACKRAFIVTNMVANDYAGRQLFHRFREVVAAFLKIELVHLGSVPSDPHVRRAALHKRCIVDKYPLSLAGQAYARLATAVEKEARTVAPNLDSHFFGERAHVPAA